MITPVEIESRTFKSGGLGYDKKDVDMFFKEIKDSYETLYHENLELKDRIGVLNEGVKYYRTIEKTLQKALVLAEKTAEDTREAAKRDAERITREAEERARSLTAEASKELDELHKKTVELLQQYEKYKIQVRNLASAQIELLDSDSFSIHLREPEKITEQVAGSPADKSIAVPSRNNISVADDYSEYDFSGLELDGQEEFDFLDLKDTDN